jgi:hypothetical protein
MFFFIPGEKEFFCVHVTTAGLGTKTGLGYTLSLATVAPTIPAFPVIGPNNF